MTEVNFGFPWGRWRPRRRRRDMRVVHVASGLTAMAMAAPDGLVYVQFDAFDHPQSHGWHLHPRHHFSRRPR